MRVRIEYHSGNMAFDALRRMLGMNAGTSADTGAAKPPEPTKPLERRERRVEAKELPPFSVGAATEASPWHPDVNQDAFAVDAKRQLLMVADGVSGAAKGEVASGVAREAVEELGPELDEMIQDAREATGSSYLTVEQASDVMDAHFRMIADRVKVASKQTPRGGKTFGPSTTLSTAKIFETAPGELHAIVKSVGDCQPMVLRANGTLERVDIQEDSLAAAWIRDKKISEDELYLISEAGSLAEFQRAFLAYQAELGTVPQSAADLVNDVAEKSNLDGLSDAARADIARVTKYFNSYYGEGPNRQQRQQSRSIITEFVGGKPGADIDVHSAVVKLNPGDRLILATDGIDALKRAQVREALSRGATVEQAARSLVAAAGKANEKGDLRAKPDDITVVGMEVPRAETRPSQRLVEAGFDDDVAYAQGTVDDLARSLDSYRDAHPQLADLAVIEAGGGDPKTRAQYVELMSKYARQYPGGVEGLKRDAQPFRAEERALQGRIAAMQSELTLAQARQQLFETQRAAKEDDPESPVWKKRMQNAQHRVKQLKRLSEMSRAQADVQGVEAARSRARAAAEKMEKS